MKTKLILTALLLSIFQLQSVGINIETDVLRLDGYPIHGLEFVRYERAGFNRDGLYLQDGFYLRMNPTIALNNAGLLGFCASGLCTLTGIIEICSSFIKQDDEAARAARWSGVKNLTAGTALGFLSAVALKNAHRLM